MRYNKLGRLFRTIRYLKAQQIFHRLYYSLRNQWRQKILHSGFARFKRISSTAQVLGEFGGHSPTQLAEKYSIVNSTIDYETVLEDDSVKGVLITTRHNLHASMIVDALQAGKDVFVENPLALNQTELGQIIGAKEKSGILWFCGSGKLFCKRK